MASFCENKNRGVAPGIPTRAPRDRRVSDWRGTQDHRHRRGLEVQEPEQGRVPGWQQNSDRLEQAFWRENGGRSASWDSPQSPPTPPFDGLVRKLTNAPDSPTACPELHRIW